MRGSNSWNTVKTLANQVVCFDPDYFLCVPDV